MKETKDKIFFKEKSYNKTAANQEVILILVWASINQNVLALKGKMSFPGLFVCFFSLKAMFDFVYNDPRIITENKG